MVKKVLRQKMKKGMKKMMAFALIAATAFSTKLPVNAVTATNTELKVHYFNVGLGTCAILEKDNHFALIDTGMNNDEKHAYALSNIQNWISNKKKVVGEKNFLFDYVVISHYDSDHVKNLRKILKLDDNTGKNPNTENDIPVGKFLARKYSLGVMKKMIEKSSENITYFSNYVSFANTVALSSGKTEKPIDEAQLDKVKTKNISTREDFIESIHNSIVNIQKDTGMLWKNPINDFSCKFTDGVDINFYSLNDNMSYIPTDEYYKEAVNNDSLVFKITYGTSSFWFLNDLKKSGLRDLLVGRDATQKEPAKAAKVTKADFKNSVVLLPHHGIVNDTIITSKVKKNGTTIEKSFKQKLANVKIFVRSVDERNLKSNQKKFMKMFEGKETFSSKNGYKLYSTAKVGSFTISTTGNGSSGKLYTKQNITIN